MPITLDDAIGRAQLMSTNGILRQESYNLLHDKLDEKDRHAFTMSLVDRGIQVRTSSRNDKEDVTEEFVKVSQSYVKRGPLWVPDSYDTKSDDEGYQELGDEDIDVQWDTSDYEDLEDIGRLREVLESAGLRVDKDGKVEFYKQNIPGIYTTKLPQAMPLDKAISYYEQLMRMGDKEEERINGLLDILSRLTSETEEIEYTLDELAKYKFDVKSKSKSTKEIGNSLNSISQFIREGDWNKAQVELDKTKGILDEYLSGRSTSYESNLSVIDALDRLLDMYQFDKDKFDKYVGGVGALAANKKMKEARRDEEFEVLVSQFMEAVNCYNIG